LFFAHTEFNSEPIDSGETSKFSLSCAKRG
jgi:hypothetical protein